MERWPNLVDMVRADIKKEQGKADWKTFINAVEKVLLILFLLFWAAINVAFYAHGWY